MDYFAHNFITRKSLVALMNFLSDVWIEKLSWDETNQVFIPRKYINVPVQYCTRDKFLEIYESHSARKMMPPEDSNAPVEIQWILPRISVNLQGVVYDTERHVNKTNQIQMGTDNVYAPVPYNLEIEVSSIAKSMDDSFQIMEQILPYFAPGKSMDIKLYNDVAESVPITLNTISFDFPQDVAEAEERLYTVTYYFSMRINYYLQKNPSKIIKNVTVTTEHDTSMGIHFHIDKTDTMFEQFVINANTPVPSLTSVSQQFPSITFKKKGEYSAQATYSMFDLVEFEGNSFVWINKESKAGVQPGSVGWDDYWTFKAVLNKNTVEFVEQ